MLAKCNLAAVIFSANQNQKPTKELAYCISLGNPCRNWELNWTIIHYLWLYYPNVQEQKKEAVIYPDSAKYVGTWYQMDQIISGLHGCHWSTHSSTRLLSLFTWPLSSQQKSRIFSEKTKYAEVANTPKDCLSALLTQIRKQFPPGVCFALYNRPGCDKLGGDWILISGALIYRWILVSSSVRLRYIFKKR